ncbi:MAG: basic amino acid ABC transporter substrate-binding protein [Ruminococcaceae bacterium]|jgi:polar amino acid transport system substrate-binding protein|nr:basic amino acid ABC transporter substrate-binding protein [Oscillospiraceae bacterium]
MKYMHFTKRLSAALCALVLALALCACGGKSDTPTYKVLTNATFPPFDTVDDSGAIVGFDMDLIAAIGADQGFAVEFTDMAFEALIPAIETGNGDIIAAGMWSGDPERQARVDFSEPYWTDGSALLVQVGNTDITGLDSLTASHKVATQIATNYADDLEAMVAEGKLGQAVILDGFDTCVLQLMNGDVDAVMAGKSIVDSFMKQHPDDLKVVGDRSNYEDLGFAVQKGNSELLDKINAGLKNVMDNGTYDKLLEKWGLK